MLDQMYKAATPWAAASKMQKLKNRILGKIANYLYPIYCKLNPIADKKQSPRKDYKVIVSLTSFPARINKVHICINSILRQSKPADKVILWLAESQFPQKADLPRKLLDLKKHGLEIRFCKDLRSYKKVFFIAQEYQDAIIITADDDTFYPESWIEGLLAEAEKNENCVVCYRAHKMKVDGNKFAPYAEWTSFSPGEKGPSLMLIPIGVGGVLYPVGYFKNVVFDAASIRKLCPTADDLWLKTIGLKNGYKAVKVFAHSKEWFTVKSSQKENLTKSNVGENLNDIAMSRLVDYYKIDVCGLTD